MATLRRHPQSGIFYLDYRHPADGRRVQQSLRTRDQKIAKQALKSLETAAVLGPAQAQAMMPVRLEEVLDAYWSYCDVHKAPRTAEHDRTRLRRFLDAARANSLAEVSPRQIEAYQAQRLAEVTQATASRDMQTVRAFFRWAVAQEYLAKNPCAGVKALGPGNQSRPGFLSLEELDALLAEAAKPIPMTGRGGKGRGRTRPRRTPLVPMIALATYAGLRLGEIIHLRWQDLVLQGPRPLVTVSVTEEFAPKDGESRVIPMHERLRTELMAYAQTQQVQSGYLFTTRTGNLYLRDNLLRELKRLARRLGVACHWYTLRHTFASQLVMEGVSIFKVSRFLGHASVTTTERHYAHLKPEALHEDINRIGRRSA